MSLTKKLQSIAAPMEKIDFIAEAIDRIGERVKFTLDEECQLISIGEVAKMIGTTKAEVRKTIEYAGKKILTFGGRDCIRKAAFLEVLLHLENA